MHACAHAHPYITSETEYTQSMISSDTNVPLGVNWIASSWYILLLKLPLYNMNGKMSGHSKCGVNKIKMQFSPENLGQTIYCNFLKTIILDKHNSAAWYKFPIMFIFMIPMIVSSQQAKHIMYWKHITMNQIIIIVLLRIENIMLNCQWVITVHNKFNYNDTVPASYW